MSIAIRIFAVVLIPLSATTYAQNGIAGYPPDKRGFRCNDFSILPTGAASALDRQCSDHDLSVMVAHATVWKGMDGEQQAKHAIDHGLHRLAAAFKGGPPNRLERNWIVPGVRCAAITTDDVAIIIEYWDVYGPERRERQNEERQAELFATRYNRAVISNPLSPFAGSCTVLLDS